MSLECGVLRDVSTRVLRRIARGFGYDNISFNIAFRRREVETSSIYWAQESRLAADLMGSV
jgi:hypothetical protein